MATEMERPAPLISDRQRSAKRLRSEAEHIAVGILLHLQSPVIIWRRKAEGHSPSLVFRMQFCNVLYADPGPRPASAFGSPA